MTLERVQSLHERIGRGYFGPQLSIFIPTLGIHL